MNAMKYLLIAAAAGFLLKQERNETPPTDGPPPNETAAEYGSGNETAGAGNETIDYEATTTTGNETTEEKIEDKQERIEEKFEDGDCDCHPDVVETCKGLWEAKEAECEEHKEEWAGMCSAPQYTDPNTGELRDCQKGCCSEAGQETGMEHAVQEEEPEPQRIWNDCSYNGEIGVAQAEACIANEIPPFLGCLAGPLAECMTKSYGDGDGVITKEEFFSEFGQHMDACFEKSIRKEDGTMALPCPGFEEELAAHMAGEDQSEPEEPPHFCDYHDPEEFPCCQKQTREEQDSCLKEELHFCDTHDPEEFTCCKLTDRAAQDECLEDEKKSKKHAHKKRNKLFLHQKHSRVEPTAALVRRAL